MFVAWKVFTKQGVVTRAAIDGVAAAVSLENVVAGRPGHGVAGVEEEAVQCGPRCC